MPPALLWLLGALVLAGAEALTGDMFLLMLGGGALAAAGSSALLGWPVWADGVVFLVVSVLLLIGVRPALRRRLARDTAPRTGIEALTGRDAEVVEQVAGRGGRVLLDGQVWSARPLNDGDVYAPGDRVTVMAIDGATAVVWQT
ncbi:NfeD family protein [Mycolicibacillus parakoreensis]|uniref:NfeD family protein n=1 Tax=Mycolicibacillus parakoreensis TaxID=1069221 RepID=A0ABY3U171_9MYCO|nr:NfeD family protein [Mycolicibacillus parakoreensis]MCV7316807.1 NfeD family protein [Mycolicibacillus parakoreensis]ULN51174.1 NfeD family protein [Mycolicibacillus parakoreensis]HLR98635.1 NfeD family protein [Mycolicibacillus parakoreensis]